MKYLNPKYKEGKDIYSANCEINPEDYDYVDDMECGCFEMWEHYETKEKIFVPIVTNRYWDKFKTYFKI